MRWIRIALLLGLCWCVSGCINIQAPVLPKFGGGDGNDKNDKDDKDDEDDERKDNSSSSQLPAPHLPTTVTGSPAAAAGGVTSLPAWPGPRFSAPNKAPCFMPATPSPIGANPSRA